MDALAKSDKEKVYCSQCDCWWVKRDIRQKCCNCFCCVGCEIYFCPTCEKDLVVIPVGHNL